MNNVRPRIDLCTGVSHLSLIHRFHLTDQSEYLVSFAETKHVKCQEFRHDRCLLCSSTDRSDFQLLSNVSFKNVIHTNLFWLLRLIRTVLFGKGEGGGVLNTTNVAKLQSGLTLKVNFLMYLEVEFKISHFILRRDR